MCASIVIRWRHKLSFPNRNVRKTCSTWYCSLSNEKKLLSHLMNGWEMWANLLLRYGQEGWPQPANRHVDKMRKVVPMPTVCKIEGYEGISYANELFSISFDFGCYSFFPSWFCCCCSACRSSIQFVTQIKQTEQRMHTYHRCCAHSHIHSIHIEHTLFGFTAWNIQWSNEFDSAMNMYFSYFHYLDYLFSHCHCNVLHTHIHILLFYGNILHQQLVCSNIFFSILISAKLKSFVRWKHADEIWLVI